MIISHDRQTLFIGVPKNGSQTARAVLGHIGVDLVGEMGRHPTVPEAIRLAEARFPGETIAPTAIYAFWRDPVAATKQPEDGACHFSAEIRSYEDHPLVVARVEHNLAQVLYFQEFAEPVYRVAATAIAVEILLINIDDLGLIEAGNVGGVFQGLPCHVPTAVIQFILDHDQIAIFVERKQVKPFAGFIEPIKLFLDNEELFAKGIRLVCQPFLKVVPFTQLEVRKAFLDEARKAVLGKVDAEHQDFSAFR